MTDEINFSGTFSQSTAESFREALPGIQVVVVSGLSGERIIKVLGSLTKGQIAAVRDAIVRLVGANQIRGLTVTRDKVTIAEVPAGQLDRAKDAALEIMDALREQAAD